MPEQIGIIDADLIRRTRHRFPNLACMKISAFEKANGNNVTLLLSYDEISSFDKVYISKVFTETPVPDNVLTMPNVIIGGTGFFYDKAPPLPPPIEHIMPDYTLYTDWVKSMIASGNKRSDFKFYLDYSIGFLTRGCFRHCSFCINRNCNRVEIHSPLYEFLDSEKPKICLLDDNFLGCASWERLLNDLRNTGKPFRFQQGLDERLLTDEKCRLLFQSKYDGDITFAFDNIKDAPMIESKLQIIRKHTDRPLRFYVLCGFDREEKYDLSFWQQDLWDTWNRVALLIKYRCFPYIMRFNRYQESPYRGMYISLARWCNQPSIFKKKSFREFAALNEKFGSYSTKRYLMQVEEEIPTLANIFFDLKWEVKTNG